MKSNAGKVQLWILFLSIFMPNLFNIRLIGMNLTFGRTVLIVLLLLCLYREEGKIVFRNRLETVCMVFFCCWVLYGILLMALNGSVHKEGLKEITNIFMGAMTVYCTLRLIGESGEMLGYSIEILRKLVAVCILVGIFETISGEHLRSSCFNDPAYIYALTQRYGSVNMYQATGFQYGTNDFCSFLVFFFPVFLLKRKGKVFDYLMIGAIAVICAVNSSTLCLLTLILGTSYFFLKEKQIKPQNVFKILAILPVLYVAWKWLQYSYGNSFSLMADLKNHLDNYLARGGSSYSRFWTYIKSLALAADTYFVGLGPANFTAYVAANPAKEMLLNPHNLWLEIFTEYGIMILVFYVVFLSTLFCKAGDIYKKSGVQRVFLIRVMLIDYIIVGIVPSTFISYLYQWILLALGIAIVKIHGIKRRRNW